jgi:tRNA uridine 5-carboxymethylaminomethyl modification enzyme
LKIREQEPWCPRRDEAYLGVLVDDLITRGTNEPYRMFTSRAEYRLLLREDNADLRLTEKGRELGLVPDERWQMFCIKRENIESERKRLHGIWIHPNTPAAVQIVTDTDTSITREVRALELLARQEVNYSDLQKIEQIGPGISDPKVTEQIEIQCKYAGYIKRQQTEIEKHKANEEVKIPELLNYADVRGLSSEVREKLIRSKPETVGQAGRIPGVTPAAISLLLIHLKKKRVA